MKLEELKKELEELYNQRRELERLIGEKEAEIEGLNGGEFRCPVKGCESVLFRKWAYKCYECTTCHCLFEYDKRLTRVINYGTIIK